MKVWSYEEIKDCYKSIYADLNWKDVEGRFTKWGKTPRICFTLRDNTLESNLQSVLQLPETVQLIMERMLSDGPLTDQRIYQDCQRFTQLNPDESLSWSSPYVQLQFYSRFSDLLTSLSNRSKLMSQSSHISLL